VIVESAVTVTIRPPATTLIPEQQELLAAFSKYITARYRFQSHPWIVDPDYQRAVLPGGPDVPNDVGTTGLVGPLTIQILTVDVPKSSTGTVNYCIDHRSLRYLGRDGTVDIPGPAGDHRHGEVALENTAFQLTHAAAADGKTSETPRWLAFKGGYLPKAPQCQQLAASPPPKPPTPSTPTAG